MCSRVYTIVRDISTYNYCGISSVCDTSLPDNHWWTQPVEFTLRRRTRCTGWSFPGQKHPPTCVLTFNPRPRQRDLEGGGDIGGGGSRGRERTGQQPAEQNDRDEFKTKREEGIEKTFHLSRSLSLSLLLISQPYQSD